MQIINRINEIRKVTNQQDSAPVNSRNQRLNRGLALSLSLLSLVSVLSPALSPSAFAADEVKAVDSSKSESSKSESGNTETSKAETGKSESSKAVEVKEIKKVEKPSASEVVANSALDSIAIHLINTGDWKGLIERLNKQLGAESGKSEADKLKRSYRQGWLAFAYMFNAKPEQSQAL
ncbi:hypothetical protein KA344_12115, partial [bacterium]|nr:hypothetical protein [bacterium]